MAHGRSDTSIIAETRNTARFFVENRHISWVALVATLLWGIYGYVSMPKRKDPDIPVRVAVAVTPWPGAGAEKVEQLVTRRVEERIADNPAVEKIESISQAGLSVVYVTLHERVVETGRELDDIRLRLEGMRDLPQGAGPIQFMKDFGDTAALMLTVASPPAGEIDVELRAQSIRRAIERARAGAGAAGGERATLVVAVPFSTPPQAVARLRDLFAADLERRGLARDVRAIEGPGFTGVDAVVTVDDARLLAEVDRFARERMRASELHPDLWAPIVVRDPAGVEDRLLAVRGDKYSYRELDRITERMKRTLQTVPAVAKVTRSGVLKERIYLEYSQPRLAAYGLRPAAIEDLLAARNITLPGGVMEIEGRNVAIDPSGEFRKPSDIGDVIVMQNPLGAPVYLRDLVEISRDYESPPSYLNFFSRRSPDGTWIRTRAITLAVQMRPGEQIDAFGAAVDQALTRMRQELPEDLAIARTSDQPRQVEESVDLFMRSLYEAIVLVVLVALVGFREWRSAALMATSIPLTLAMTFGMMYMLGIDVQQVSIASLIIALGLLVDDPVVAGDAIKRDLDAGHPSAIASWLGPTKLATAILYATLTNIVAYLPLLLLGGDTGTFLHSLPVVLTCSLVASRIVSMTFIPLLGYYLLRPSARPVPLAEQRTRGMAGLYYRAGGFALDHRWLVTVASLAFLGLGAWSFVSLKTLFFPKDQSYLSYVDLWLPEDAPLSATDEAATRAEDVIRAVAEEYGRAHPGDDGQPREVLESITTFLGGGGPRFWFSVSPEQEQLNYAQMLIQVKDKHDTNHLVVPLQQALSAQLPGVLADVRQLDTGSAVGIPVAVRIAGEDTAILRGVAEQVKEIFRSIPAADRVRDDWGAESFVVRLQVDPDRANLAGVSNLDIAGSSAAGMSGVPVTTLRDGDVQIPVLARLRMEERARLADLASLYVYSSQGSQRVPLSQVSTLRYGMESVKTRSRSQFRTVTVSAFPAPEALPSEVIEAARARLDALAAELPPGYRLEIGGEDEEQRKGFRDLAVVMAVSIALIYLMLVVQFRNAVKPLIVFAAIPYGMVGALAALVVMRTPFDFMAFLGIASLVGVIVSHVIVLFDFIEEMHERGEPFREAVLDAGVVRLRPVFITVGATVLALVPLAMHGGPLWEPLCYTQIGGLLVANFITKLLVPALYAICVLDLGIVRWETAEHPRAPAAA